MKRPCERPYALSRLWGKPKGRILRRIFRSSRVFRPPWNTYLARNLLGFMDLLVYRDLGLFLFEGKAICGLVTSGQRWMEWFPCWQRSLTTRQKLKDMFCIVRSRIFSQPPLISFKRDKNKGNFLVRSAFQTSNQAGTFKCPRAGCKACPFICKVEKLSGPKRSIKITDHFTCTSTNTQPTIPRFAPTKG